MTFNQGVYVPISYTQRQSSSTVPNYGNLHVLAHDETLLETWCSWAARHLLLGTVPLTGSSCSPPLVFASYVSRIPCLVAPLFPSSGISLANFFTSAIMDPANLPSNPNENGAADILGSTLFVVCLATVVVLARLYVRVFIIRGTGWDVSSFSSMHVLPCFFPISYLYPHQLSTG